MKSENNNIILEPIGICRSTFKHRYEVPRQGVLAGGVVSCIELLPANNYEQALIELQGFERIWVIYQFHLNENWKPLVNPPAHSKRKVGVFASRSPHRPNPLGLSCVKLERIEGLNIYISESDILDGSPILDIKPYLPFSDSFPDAATGWVKDNPPKEFEINYGIRAAEQIDWLIENAGIDLYNFIELQLGNDPLNAKRKRVSQEGEKHILAYRTWRISFTLNVNAKTIFIDEVFSVFSSHELKALEDKYGDKTIHEEYMTRFGS